MRKKPVHKNSNTLGVAFVFICIVFFAVLISLVIKGYIIVRKSHFDGQHQMILEIQNKNSKDFIIFNPSTNSISDLKIYGNIYTPILIPDAVVKNISYTNPRDLTQKLILGLSNYNTDLTIFDAFRIFTFTFSIDKLNTTQKTIVLPRDENTLSQIFPQKFSDTAIYKEAIPVAIVNDTGISGVGSKLSQVLTNMGVNVVVVSTGNLYQKSRMTYIQNQTYTSVRLSKLLGIDAQETNTITNDSDIAIFLGKDKLYLINN